MKIREIYERAYRRGMELDPRGGDEVAKVLERTKKDYEDLKEKERKWFDMEALENPFADTRILYGDPEGEVRRVMVGIDVEVGEVLLADRLGGKGTPVDLIIAHHPEGRPMARLYDVMDMQAGILNRYGVPINVAESLMSDRIKEVERRLMPANHTRAVDAAKLLGIPMMCIHTPSDNAVTDYLQRLFDDATPRYVSDVVDTLRDIPEYRAAMEEAVGPKVVVGSARRRAGKVFVDMTGGTGGSKKAFEKLSQAGVGTVVGMHIGEEHRKEAEKHHINVVLAGHISSDNLGLNLLLDYVLDGVDVVACSGFRRITRK
ncbi:MAG TPA: NGG1p interacting factor NIF3 [Deltaproteobacteria bacterium]|nr:NGG1p interacting factor NIF3 [Deltaproteobacteria bacterium]